MCTPLKTMALLKWGTTASIIRMRKARRIMPGLFISGITRPGNGELPGLSVFINYVYEISTLYIYFSIIRPGPVQPAGCKHGNARQRKSVRGKELCGLCR